MSRSPLTARGAAKLREELDRLKSTDRPEIIEAIAEARSHGDLKENAEYHAAREQQGFIEGRISELEDKLANAEVIDVSTLAGKDKIVFGATVDLFDLDSEDEVTYQIVGDGEASIEQGLISVSSPLARALINKQAGDVAEVDAPRGRREYEVVDIRYE